MLEAKIAPVCGAACSSAQSQTGTIRKRLNGHSSDRPTVCEYFRRTRKKATPAQIALAWVLAQKLWIAPIPGATKLRRLKENIGAIQVELTVDDLREIENATSQITAQGARYPENPQRLVGR